MSIVEQITKWYKDEVMVHAMWEDWDTEDFHNALKVIKKYEDKVNEPGYKEFNKKRLFDSNC